MRTIVRLKAVFLAGLPDRWSRALRRIRHRYVVAHATAAEEPDLAVLPALLPPGSRALDVGANIGVYTRQMSDLVGANGVVLSIEPMPITFDILRGQRLRYDNVIWINCAVSSRRDLVRMTTPSYPEGGANYYQSHVVKDDERGAYVEIPAETIDSLVVGRGSIDFIKCDVEGHELACIQGAQLTLRESKPAWLIEISGNPDETDSQARLCLDALAEHGYRCFWLKDDGRLHLRKPGDTSINYFFLTENHLQRCRAAGLAVVAD